MDIAIVLARTEEEYGTAARRRYEALIAAALRAIAADPFRLGSAARPEIGEGVRTYHMRHSRAQTAAAMVRRPRHFLLYRCVSSNIVGVGRVLHEAMELSRHIPAVYGDE